MVNQLGTWNKTTSLGLGPVRSKIDFEKHEKVFFFGNVTYLHMYVHVYAHWHRKTVDWKMAPFLGLVFLMAWFNAEHEKKCNLFEFCTENLHAFKRMFLQH